MDPAAGNALMRENFVLEVHAASFLKYKNMCWDIRRHASKILQKKKKKLVYNVFG
jgi:hypothetical protein